MTSNDDQSEYWNNAGGARWVAHQEALDALVRPFGRAALNALQVKPGEHALDVGCGCGETLLSLSEAVAPNGSVTGIDLSRPMLARARERAPNAVIIAGDASTHCFERRYDALFSRFGVMFFADPVAAFAHLRAALTADGRIAFVSWRSPAENGWASVPARALRTAVPELQVGVPEQPDAPGPFAFAARDRVFAILRDAGFTAIQVEPFDHEVELSRAGLAEAVHFALTVGPVSRFLAQASEAQKVRATEAVTNALAAHLRGERVALPGAAWVVAARRG